MKSSTLIALNLFVCVVFSSLSAFAAGSDNSVASPSKPAAYHQAQKLIENKQYDEAVIRLKEAEKASKNDADIHNLLGFSYRKSGKLAEAATYYEKALILDPKHKGALEYQGELFLMIGDKMAAEKNLEKLEKICWLGCDELDDLRAAITTYKP